MPGEVEEATGRLTFGGSKGYWREARGWGTGAGGGGVPVGVRYLPARGVWLPQVPGRRLAARAPRLRTSTAAPRAWLQRPAGRALERVRRCRRQWSGEAVHARVPTLARGADHAAARVAAVHAAPGGGRCPSSAPVQIRWSVPTVLEVFDPYPPHVHRSAPVVGATLDTACRKCPPVHAVH